MKNEGASPAAHHLHPRPLLLKVSSLTRVTSVTSVLTISKSVSQSVISLLERLVAVKKRRIKGFNLIPNPDPHRNF